MLKKEKGFTLIELMIVVAIIGILAAVAIPKFADLIDRSKEAKTKGNVSAIRSAISIYYGSQEGVSPVNLGGLCTEFMKEVPGGDIPKVGGTSMNYTITATTDDASTSSASYSARTTAADITDNWAYDSSEPEVWVQITGADTKGDAIYTW
jgi:prepilin-type N-terminal cleavage/methylation domain-containing protein